MKKQSILFVTLALIFLFAMVGCTPPGGTEGESEPLPSGGETQGQIQTVPQLPDGTEAEDLGSIDVETWGEEDPTIGQNEGAASEGGHQSGGNQTGSQSGDQGSSGNQSGSQGSQGSGEMPPVVTEPEQPQPPVESETGEPPTAPDRKTTYEEYMAMTPEQQQDFFESFPSVQAFMEWYNDAKAEYEASKDGIIIDGGDIDIGDYIEKP